jgi:NTE family protein
MAINDKLFSKRHTASNILLASALAANCGHAAAETDIPLVMPRGISLPFPIYRDGLSDFLDLVPIERSSRISNPRVGLALGGGGTRGSAHVGVIQVLTEAGIPIDCIAGTSMGSIVGGLYASGVPIDKLEEIVRKNKAMKAFVGLPLPIKFAVAPVKFVPRVLGIKRFDGLEKSTRFKRFITKLLPEDRRNIEDLHIPYCAVALNLVNGSPYAFTKGDLAQAMQASSAVPILKHPVRMDDALFVDGGVISNLPVKEARTILGANFVIAVNVDERFTEEPIEEFLKVGSVASRIIKLELANKDHAAMLEADIVIHPKVEGIGLLSTKPSDAVKALEAGRQAARNSLPALRMALEKRGVRLARKEDETNKEVEK